MRILIALIPAAKSALRGRSVNMEQLVKYASKRGVGVEREREDDYELARFSGKDFHLVIYQDNNKGKLRKCDVEVLKMLVSHE